MKIYINQDEIDFTLENEKSLGDVFTSLEAWLSSQGYSVSEIQLDGTDLDIQNMESWKDLDFGNELHISALTLQAMKAQNLETLLNYCRMLQSSLREGNISLLNDLLAEYSYIEGSYAVLLDDYSHTIRNHMASILSQNGFIPESDRSEEQVKTVLESFIMLEAVILGRYEEVTDPRKSGKDCYSAILALMPEMEEVSLYLQTGKDKEAMDIIIRFSELFQKLLRVYTYLPSEEKADHQEGLKEYIKDMSGILKELTEAFSTQDSVLMGDLMEYEILPRMKSFPAIFESIGADG